MTDQAEQPILRRKARARRASLGLTEMTPTKAMRVALAKAGDKVLKVPVTLRSYKSTGLMPENLGDTLPDPSLILRLQGLGDGVGLAVLCPQTVAAVIEAQTMGRVAKAEAPSRRATATDATMARRFVDLAVEGFSQLAEACGGMPALDGFAVAGRCADARAAAMALADASHSLLTVEIDFAGGAKSGTIHLVLPDHAPVAQLPGDKTSWAAALERAVMDSPARLQAMLCTFKMPLSEARTLSVDQVVPLSQANLNNVQLIAMNGRRVLRARLGRSGNMRAVRLRFSDAPATALTRDMGDLKMAGSGAARSAPAPQTALPAATGLDMPAPVAEGGGTLPDLPAVQPDALTDRPAALDPAPMPSDLTD